MGTGNRMVRQERSPSRQSTDPRPAEMEALERRLLLSAAGTAQVQEDWDFGDAPESYLTVLADNGARHAIDPDGPWLGKDGGDTDFPDAEPDGQPDATAQGDDKDTDPLNPDPNYDDEDGIGVAGGAYLVLVQAQISDIKVVVSGPGGVLTAWVDWDADGTWQHPAEQIYNGFLAAGVYYLPVTAPVDSAIGRTFGRFRISSQGEPTPEGAADDGEVEDRMVLIQGYDYGDAPDPTYPTLRSSHGAEHSINPGFHLGDGVDADPNGQGDPDALGDDMHGTDDEDGVTFTSSLIPGESATLDVRAAIPDGLSGYLDAWLDFGADGGWAETGDRIFTAEPLVDGTKSLSFSVPQTAALGPTFARFRMSLYSGVPEVSYEGHSGPGEVEDYQVQIGVAGEHDLGDAPDSSNNYGAGMTAYPVSATPADFPTVYQTGSPPYGPIHLQPRDGAYLGEGVTLENEADTDPDEDAVNNIDPLGDSADRDGQDDGVSFPLTLLHCQANTMDYTVTIVTAGEFYVNVWHDWNRDGDWNDTLECLDASGVDEWSVQNQLIGSASPGVYALTTPSFTAWHNDSATPLWMRITLSEQAWSSATPGGDREGGEGPPDGYALGETEDYYLDEFLQGEYGIHVEKATNGVDADDPTGPLVAVGGAVGWTYEVSNSGNLPLSDVTVVDDSGTPGDDTDDFHPSPILAGAYNVGDANQDGRLDPDEAWQYQAGTTAAAGQYENVATASAEDPLDQSVQDEDASHYFGVASEIHIDKATNGADADDPTGPLVAAGSTVAWTYEVTNPGNVPLEDVAVMDDNGTPGDTSDDFHPAAVLSGGFNEGDTNQDGRLDPGEVWLYIAGGQAAAGQYANGAAVTATDPVQQVVTDDDPSHYFGVQSAIGIEKATNGQDADIPTGPMVAEGGAVVWTYQVTNPGNVPLDGVTVTDDNGTPDDVDDDFNPAAVLDGGYNTGDEDQDGLLDPGEVWLYHQAGGQATAGQYGNVAAASGTDTMQQEVRDTDPSHYFGVLSRIDVEKATNGQDADSPAGPLVLPGSAVTWTYEVRNTGNLPLIDVRVVDDSGTPGQVGDDFHPDPVLSGGFNIGDLNQDGRLDVDEVWEYEAAGVAGAGQYANTATATGEDVLDQVVTDTDRSHYFGVRPDVTIEKSTEGDDADSPTGPLVAVGSTVSWTYAVTNTGNIALDGVIVTDDNGTPGAGGDDFHPAPVLAGGFNVGDVNRNGLLDPGEEWRYEADGIAVTGQYGNMATVAVSDPLDETVTDDDPSHYFGVVAGIDVQKATHGEDADDPTGPMLPVGILVGWTYEVRNTGNVPLGDVTVVDDHGTPGDPGDDFNPTPVRAGGRNVGDLNRDDLLDVGEVWQYKATGLTIAGQYENIATATGTDPIDREVADEDRSHYFGARAAIRVEKATNGDDADDPTGPQIPTGEPVHWTYAVSNEGNVPLGGVAVTDDHGTPSDPGDDFHPAPVLDAGLNVGDLNRDGRLDVDEVWQYQADGVALTGQYENVATATGTDPIQQVADDDDPSHYFGQPIDLGDAPDPTYPTLLAGNGARHVIGGPWLGDNQDAPDAEPDGQPDADALGDDADTGPLNPGPNKDDEDGVTIPLLIPGEWARITVEVNGGGGVVQGWLDWNGDGVWHATDELIYAGYLPADTHTLLVQPPQDSVTGWTFARFRISEQGNLPPDGLALSGEVEDHRAYIQGAPEITLTDSWSDPDDASIAFYTPLSAFRPGTSDSPLVRPAYPDAGQYVDVTNTGTAPLTLFEIQILAPDVAVGGPVMPLVLPPDETQRFHLTYQPSLPTLGDPAVQDFGPAVGMVIVSDAENDSSAEVALEGHSTFNSDISYDGSVNLGELGLLNVNFGRSVGHPAWDPTTDINGDGAVNLGDLGSLNVEFGRERTMPVPAASPAAAAQSPASDEAEQSKVLGPTIPVEPAPAAPADAILAAAARALDPVDDAVTVSPADGWHGSLSAVRPPGAVLAAFADTFAETTWPPLVVRTMPRRGVVRPGGDASLFYTFSEAMGSERPWGPLVAGDLLEWPLQWPLGGH